MKCVATLGRPGLPRLYHIFDNVETKEFTIVRENEGGELVDVHSFTYAHAPKDIVYEVVEEVLCRIVKETPHEIVTTD
jgi:hypothetical protein